MACGEHTELQVSIRRSIYISAGAYLTVLRLEVWKELQSTVAAVARLLSHTITARLSKSSNPGSVGSFFAETETP